MLLDPRLGLVFAAALLAGCATLLRLPQPQAPTPAMLSAVRALDGHPCNAATAGMLEGLRLRPEDLSAIHYEPRIAGSENTYLVGYDAWVRLGGQAGTLVIRHSPACAPTTGFIQGDVGLPQR